MPGKVKSYAQRDKENRCQGTGPGYVPYIKAEEARSIGVASRIYDPIEGRDISLLSETERLTYDEIRWDPDTVHIREQYLMDIGRIRDCQKMLGQRQTGDHFTADLVVDYADGTRTAYFIKRSAAEFIPSSRQYQATPGAYTALVNRYSVEKLYWMMEGAQCRIRTIEMCNRVLSTNVETVMQFYDPKDCYSIEQMALCLIAHRILIFPHMDSELIVPARYRADGMIRQKFEDLLLAAADDRGDDDE